MTQQTSDFWAKASVLDGLKELDAPTQAQVEQVLDALTQDEYRRYFFHDLKNPAWLGPLHERGVFKTPQRVVRRGTVVECPSWEASSYLTDMASVRPDMFVRIALDIDTDNPSVYLNVIRAAVLMPASVAAALTDRVVDWVTGSDLWVDLLCDAAQELMVHLAAEGELDSAIEVLVALTDPIEVERVVPVPGQESRSVREVRSRCSSWYFKRLMQQRLPTLLGLDPLGVAAVLESQLRKSVGLEGAVLPGGDGSYLWRPAIESHPQNWGEEHLKTVLTVGLRDALELAAEDQPDTVGEIIEQYLKDHLSIFRRLALHLIRVGGDRYDALAAQAVRDPMLRDDPPLHHEYYRLLEDRFAKLPETVRKEYLEWVDTGPNVEDFKKWAEQVAGEQPSHEDIQVHKERWQLEQLKPLRNALPDHWRARYETLVSRYGEPEHPEFLIWSSTKGVGPTSPRKKEELREMGPGRTIQCLKTFQPSGEPFDDSRWGLARELQAAVEEDTPGYVAIANKFLEERLHPTYVYHLVTGLHEAWKKGADLDWKPLLGFFEPVSMAMTGEGEPLAEHTIGVDDTSWVGVRMAISRFLSGALARDDRDLAPEVIPKIRQILLRLIQDPDPTRENEQDRYGGVMDWVSIRINTARGVAASALLEYALRYARMHKSKHEAVAGEQGHAHRMEPALKAAFTRMLDKEKEPSAAVHSLFGQFLPNFLFLDRQWVVSQLDRIFPPEAENQRYWEAAWQGYMLYCPRVYRELYQLLRPQYLLALRTLADEDSSYAIRNARDAIAQHIAIAYRMGYEDLEPLTNGTPIASSEGGWKPSLLHAFLEVASDELRAGFVRGLGSSLGPEKDVPQEQWTRMRDYWETRTQPLPAAPSGYEMDQELSAFISWVRGVPEDLQALAPLLRPSVERLARGHDAHDLLAYLSEQSQSHPLLATEMLRLLLDREAVLARGPDANRIYLIGAEQHIWTILENAMGAEGAARESSISLINLLGERGDYRYRELLRRRD